MSHLKKQVQSKNQQNEESKNQTEDKKPIQYQKDSIIKLTGYQDKQIRINFLGGREVVGILKGFDTQNNMILDECFEFLRDPHDPYIVTDKKRNLGLVFAKGSQLMTVSPVEGFQEIANPFDNQQEQE